jgi:RHS repeat-associated protein
MNLTCNGTGADTSPMHFTGKQRDYESGNDYFGARHFASSLGRFMTPDWSEEPEAVPYSNLQEPQTLNLYAYVGNNPMARADPDGHCNTSVYPIRCSDDWLNNFPGIVEGQKYSIIAQNLTPAPSPGPAMPPPSPPLGPTGAAGGTAEAAASAETIGSGAALATAGLILVDAGLLAWDAYQGYKLYQSYSKSQDPPGREITPNINKDVFEPIRGTPAKRNKITGETWEVDKSGHRGPHFEVYRNKRDFENRKRDRAVDPQGNTIKKY